MALRIVGTLLVRDEADVVEFNIRHHLDQGIRPIIVTDNGSIDGTRAKVEQFVASGDVVLLDEPGRDYRQYAWVTRMARMAATEFGAAWVFNIDADEFWLPTDRNERLADVLGRVDPSIDVVAVTPHDLRSLRYRNDEGEHWSKLLVWRDDTDLNEKGERKPPKAVHRGIADVQVHQGNHGVVAGRPLVQSSEVPISLLHVPLRTYRQYFRKIENGGQAYANNDQFSEHTGWHWREEYQRLQDGALPHSYRERRLGARELALGLLTGRIRRDTWLRERIGQMSPGESLENRSPGSAKSA